MQDSHTAAEQGYTDQTHSGAGDAAGTSVPADAADASAQSPQPLNLSAALAADQLPAGIELVEGGGVCTPQGFAAAGVHAGFRDDPQRLDFAIVKADAPAQCAATFTQNAFCAAPVTVSRENLDAGRGCAGQQSAGHYGTAQVAMVNSGCANAATGKVGLETARESIQKAAAALEVNPADVLVASTGVIGQLLPLEPFDQGLELAKNALSRDGAPQAARAIMTTDTHPKQAAVQFNGDDLGYSGCVFSVGGMSKGSGMIMPNMATMIAIITTDAPIGAQDLYPALKRAVDVSFNKVTVDSDTSTNDSCFLLASGAAARMGSGDVATANNAGTAATAATTTAISPFQPGTPAFIRFEQALQAVCINLARQMAEDGEGASRLVTVNIAGAASAQDADAAARTVANSPLVKTAICGHDANWGRIAGALGRSGAAFNQEDVDIDIMGLPVCRQGLTVPFDEEEALRRFERPEIVIDCYLGAGDFATTMWTCDLTHDYVTINGDYRT